MKTLFISSVIFLFFVACEKEESDPMKFKMGTYYGTRSSHYEGVELIRIDTVTINFDFIEYSYSGTFTHDFGDGNYKIKSDSLSFFDDNARNTLYSWEWILNGWYKFEFKEDSLILSRINKGLNIFYHLKRIVE